MKKMQYPGLMEVCECRYAIGEVDGKTAVVVQQPWKPPTGIQNVIGEIASKILAADLAGTDPTTVRFFEHYPYREKPEPEWMEVDFEVQTPLADERGMVEKVLAVMSAPRVQVWSVSKPGWTRLEAGQVPAAVLRLVS